MCLRVLSLLICILTSGMGASISGAVQCTTFQSPPTGSLSCSSSTASAGAVFHTGIGFPLDARVDTAVKDPSFANNIYPYANARLHYDAMFDLTVSGSGSGYVLPFLELHYVPDYRIYSVATAAFGPVAITSRYSSGIGYDSTLISCYFYCMIPVTFGVPIRLELTLDVETTTSYVGFPTDVPIVSSFAEASLKDIYVYNEAKQRVSDAITFTETPEPAYTALILASLAFAAIWSLMGR